MSVGFHQNADKSNIRKPVIFSRTIYPLGFAFSYAQQVGSADSIPLQAGRYQALAVLQYSVTPDAPE